ncbi:MAG: GHKL domain-containing protein [Deltaproteobacteria bacterium]|nr:GHKL domain-containing protein [Deltaproteobacteria bacterium]
MNKAAGNKVPQMRRAILRRVLLVPFLILMMVCTTLVYYFATYSREQVEEKLRSTALGHSRLIDEFLSERASDLRFAADSKSLSQLSSQEQLAALFQRLQSKSDTFFDLGVFDKSGKHLAYVGPYDLAGKDYSGEAWFKAVQEMHIYISDVFLGYRNYPHFIIAVRQEGEGGPWYLRATINTMAFNDLVESVRIGRTGEVYLVNRQGIFQTKPRSGGKLMEKDPNFQAYKGAGPGVSSFAAGDYLAGRYLYAACKLERTGWILVVRQQALDAYAPLAKAVLLAAGMIIAGGAVVVVMAYILATGLASRLAMADIEKRQMKTQLIIAGKLAEIGEMSAGLAHEINNPLQVMRSEQMMIEDLLTDLETNKQDPETMRLIRESVKQSCLQIERCGKITQGLLSFARKNEISPEQIKLQEFLPQVVEMIEHRAQLENIRVVQELDTELPPITGDPNQLQQVFLNLFNNAIGAMEEKGNGEIRIKSQRENAFATVSVTDNGCGISSENMEKIFLPFFTTKQPGQGTGLGLSTAYGIVKGMGGDITVSSEVNAGTVFTVRLPLSAKTAEKADLKTGTKEGTDNGEHAASVG